MITELNERSRLIFAEIVEAFFEGGEPVGSRTLSRRLPLRLSPATIRNVMADLEDLGLLYAPHTSAGRMPTDQGLRLYVDGLLQIGDLTSEERISIDAQCAGAGRTLSEVLGQATEMLSGLSSATGLVLAPKSEAPVKHMEFIRFAEGQALAIIVLANGLVENRIIQVPGGFTPSSLTEAANYINMRLDGRTFSAARGVIEAELAEHRAALDSLGERIVAAGLGTLTEQAGAPTLILRGRAKLFEDAQAIADLERIRKLFEDLERHENMLQVIDSTLSGQAVHVFIGSENKLFNLAGCSMVIAPLHRRGGSEPGCLGAIGVIGPTRINYAHIIPMVDYTARAISRLMG
ncbi:MAG TPA: heat-inducible transcriptional repressor HrcA [Alphaproteobacteria bacterium]|jgi:heat-inducible transcriptional repressor|nr:heat-inducible transcriptional repressor HrcA [Alphaproteobacteria bacterium]